MQKPRRLTYDAALRTLGLIPGATRYKVVTAFRTLVTFGRSKALTEGPTGNHDEEGVGDLVEAYKVAASAAPTTADGRLSVSAVDEVGRGVERIQWYYDNCSVQYISEITAEDVADAFRAKKWRLLAYTAEHAKNLDVQKRAVDYFAAEKKYYSLLGIGNFQPLHSNATELNNYVLSAFEKNLDSVLAGEIDLSDEGTTGFGMSPITREHIIRRVAEFVLEGTEDFLIVRHLLNAGFCPDNMGRLVINHAPNTQIAEEILLAYEKAERWFNLVKAGRIFIGWARNDENGIRWASELWRSTTAILERNLNKIIGKDGMGAREARDYLAYNTSSLEIGKKILTTFAEAKDYKELTEIAVRTNDNNYTYLLYIDNGILRFARVNCPRPNGNEIGKYAVDLLQIANKSDLVVQISENAASDEVRTYAKEKL